MSGSVLTTGSELATAILISLFTDRQAADDDDIPDGTLNPRGWWGDLDSDYQIGSRLWLLSRSKATAETRQRATDYITEALQWLIDDGVVAKFDIDVEWSATSTLGARVIAYKKDGTKEAVAYASTWSGLT